MRERAYKIWEENGQGHGHDLDHWLRAEVETAPFMKITFDSNAWQKIVVPERFPKHEDNQIFRNIRQAVLDNEIKGYIVETVTTLEAIKRVDRAEYFSSRTSKTQIDESITPDGRLKISFKLGPDDSHHPGLMPVLEDRLSEAFKIGFKFLKIPRVGMPGPALVRDPQNYSTESSVEMGKRQDKTFAALRVIEPRGVGKTQVDDIGNKISAAHGLSGPWFENLGKATPQEARDIADAVGEWADGDSIAAHIGYENDYFCTEDQGIEAGVSILNAENKLWLEKTYGVRFVTIKELANLL
ncbi:DUF2934 domain-containing protein [Methylobacterium sp. NEAU 140]|uniref:DUF2934 domain-containing protein n=1 Tax=Methylobacterium sp. NEAU 140 TaxID=3064945 RepID=UPI0027351AA0|nr:DUF2934 domain-containing protein [Methylobacterium sp. NEAU 140]MDP4026615.1 DUF2934 domain-containing protein [Methylobacterium sp. NEAU 140]